MQSSMNYLASHERCWNHLAQFQNRWPAQWQKESERRSKQILQFPQLVLQGQTVTSGKIRLGWFTLQCLALTRRFAVHCTCREIGNRSGCKQQKKRCICCLKYWNEKMGGVPIGTPPVFSLLSIVGRVIVDDDTGIRQYRDIGDGICESIDFYKIHAVLQRVKR